MVSLGQTIYKSSKSRIFTRSWFKHPASHLEAPHLAIFVRLLCQTLHVEPGNAAAILGPVTFLPSGNVTNSYWKWPLMVDFPIKNNGSFHSNLLPVVITRGYLWVWKCSPAPSDPFGSLRHQGTLPLSRRRLQKKSARNLGHEWIIVDSMLKQPFTGWLISFGGGF